MRRVAGYMFGFMKQQAPEGRRQRDWPGRRRRLAFAPCSSHLTPRTSSRPSAACSTRRSSTPSRRTSSTRCASPATSPTSSSGRCGSVRTTRAGSGELLAELARRRRRRPARPALAERIRTGDDAGFEAEAWAALVADHPPRPRRRQARPRRVGGRRDARSGRGPGDVPRRGVAGGGHRRATCRRRRPGPAGTTCCSTPRRGGTVHHLVATIVPFGETLINSIEAEAGVRALAEKAGVAVPHVHLAREDGELVGGPFMISEFVRRRDRAPPRAAPRRRAAASASSSPPSSARRSPASTPSTPTPSTVPLRTLEGEADDADRAAAGRR